MSFFSIIPDWDNKFLSNKTDIFRETEQSFPSSSLKFYVLSLYIIFEDIFHAINFFLFKKELTIYNNFQRNLL